MTTHTLQQINKDIAEIEKSLNESNTWVLDRICDNKEEVVEFKKELQDQLKVLKQERRDELEFIKTIPNNLFEKELYEVQ